MKPVKARIKRFLNHGSVILACDNSGARKLRVISVKTMKTVKGRASAAGIGDFILCSVVDGKPDMRKTVVPAIVVRQKKEYRRADGTWIKFEDNAAVVLKDDQGNPKGTVIKGPVAKEACERWPGLPKIARIIV
jgi:large subunit ribosomal protein L14